LRPFFQALTGSSDLAIVVFVMLILVIIIVPLPPVFLDMFLTISIAIAVLVILISLYIPKPTDLTTFPTLILIITLFRLSLNVATTRMILSQGHNGPDAVSDIISSFGKFVVGGNYVIGIIIFIILVLINFMVITKGATRVAEVAARFTLDSMPGKQMAVDADLNAGLIDEKEATKRRSRILQDANFYGAMDGASKFVKGDAVAGIIITLVNIIGGFLIGIFQHDLDAGQAAESYTLLTIGDGLVGQIPALIMSTATGILITRSSDDGGSFAKGTIGQIGNDAKIMLLTGGIMMLFAMTPGLPAFSMGLVGSFFLLMSYNLYRVDNPHLPSIISLFKKKKTHEEKHFKDKTEDKPSQAPKPKRKSTSEIQAEEESAISDILKIEMLELTLGYQLIKLADINQGGDLLERIRSMRRKIASDFGLLMPQVRIRDNLQLDPKYYQILLKGNIIGEGSIEADMFLAMDSGMVTEELSGIPAVEPAFGLDAIWINPLQKDDANINGYTVVDPSTVISTHMSELIKNNAEELLTRQETQGLIDRVKADYPAVIDDVLKVTNIGVIQHVLKNLLHENIPIKDTLTILETIADIAGHSQNIDILVEQVRAKLSRIITALYKDRQGVIKLLTFETASEQVMLEHIKENEGYKQLLLNVGKINLLIQHVSQSSKTILEQGISPIIIIVDPALRKPLVEIFERFNLDIVVLSHAEIDSNAKFEVLGSINVPF
jgi:flagellar biosynthesis protein FlhA